MRTMADLVMLEKNNFVSILNFNDLQY